MTAAERREKARVRSERWRRAHGIMPRRPAQQPWLAEEISRSTWYRRRKVAREQAAAAQAVMDAAIGARPAGVADRGDCGAIWRPQPLADKGADLAKVAAMAGVQVR